MMFFSENVPLEKEEEHQGKALSFGTIVQQVVSPLFQRHPHMNLMMSWNLIVGDEMASMTWPKKILRPGGGKALLYLEVSLGAEMKAWALSAKIMERVNQYFGFQAIHSVRFLKAQESQKSSYERAGG